MMLICAQAGANVVPREGDEMTRLPFLRTWFRTRSAMVLHLSNGTLQVGLDWLCPPDHKLMCVGRTGCVVVVRPLLSLN